MGQEFWTDFQGVFVVEGSSELGRRMDGRSYFSRWGQKEQMKKTKKQMNAD